MAVALGDRLVSAAKRSDLACCHQFCGTQTSSGAKEPKFGLLVLEATWKGPPMQSSFMNMAALLEWVLIAECGRSPSHDPLG
jgi:hypothetical protein